MQTQFQYIAELATKYHGYSEESDKLFQALNGLPTEVLQDVYDEYGDPANRFQPVNVLRAEAARQLLEGASITEAKVEEIKDRIRRKDKAYFAHLSPDLLKELEEYAIGRRDIFANWQRHWSVFHTFFYRMKGGKEKETVQAYLQQIATDLQIQLQLPDYAIHWVDFQGAANFGTDYCWIALYPITKDSHRDAYQFFVRIGPESEAGRFAGGSIKDPMPNKLKPVKNYEEVVSFLKSQREDILKLNKSIRNYFKFAPGSQASEWATFYKDSIVGIDFNFDDLSKYSSRGEINRQIGLAEDDQSNKTWNLWLFKTASIGDVVFATKGVNTCLGIGIIDGSYYYAGPGIPFNHRRKVKWLTDKVYQYKASTYKNHKNLFRPDTFSPTVVHEFILSEYVRLYPELAAVFKEHNLKFVSADEESAVVNEPEVEFRDGEETKEPLNFWWLNANPKIWSISSNSEGERQTYTTHNEKGNKRRIYKYFEAARPGDLIIGYESTPTKQIKAVYEVTKGIHSTVRGEEIEFQLIEKLEIPVHWNDLKNNPALQHCEVFINNQGSLFRLTEEEYDVIREIIDNKNILAEKQVHGGQVKKYKFSEDPDKPFIREEDFMQTVALLKRKKNIILQGPPGVGKTFIARKIAYEVMQEAQDANIEMVQFHQSYSYEDFIQGLRPTQKGSFDLKDGVFYMFCQRALAHPERPFFFIIDEINRGNLSKIFGELMMLIEADKREEKYALKLTYAEDEDDRFYVPDNLYIIGTMNTADRSLAIVDYALRRRFAFVTLHPEYDSNFRAFLTERGLSSGMIDHICTNIVKLNNKIKEETGLGEGYQIGHSYFCTYRDNEEEGKWWNDVLHFELKPLLEEIWFDDSSKVQEVLKLLSR